MSDDRPSAPSADEIEKLLDEYKSMAAHAATTGDQFHVNTRNAIESQLRGGIRRLAGAVGGLLADRERLATVTANLETTKNALRLATEDRAELRVRLQAARKRLMDLNDYIEGCLT